MKRILFFCAIAIGCSVNGQVIFNEGFNSLTLNSSSYTVQSGATINTVTTTYTTVPASFAVINDGYKNNAGAVTSPNKPFHISSLEKEGWAVAFSPAVNDTFLVTTSWLDTTATLAVKRYVVTPVISVITASTVLSWEAMSADPNYREGYQVLVTTNTTGTLSAMDFTTAPLFSLQDGNTSGGGEKSTWTKRGVSLAAYAGQSIRIAFKNTSQNMYQLWLDDIKVEHVSSTLDAEVTTGKPIYKYNKINTNGNVSCRVTNRGATTINSFTLNYSIGSGAAQSQAFNITLTPYAFIDLPMNTPYSISTPGYYKVKLWVSNVNGTPDPNKNNDTLFSAVAIVSSAPSKSVMVEQMLSAFDGYSPDAQEKLEAIGQASANVIQVNIHPDDSMKISSVANLVSDYGKNFSSALIDRNYFYDINSVYVDRFSYASRISQRSSTIVPVSVSIVNQSYNTSTRVLDFTVQASFTGEVRGDYRINAYLTENYVYGPSSDVSYNGWNQLSFMYNTPWSPYYQTGTPQAGTNGHLLDAFQFKHKWVLDAALDGAYGAAGIIPSTGGTDGQSFTKAYSYTVPLAANGEFRYNPDNMYIVAFVSEYETDKNNRTVLNAVRSKLTTNAELVTVKENQTDNAFELYPNPSSGQVNIFRSSSQNTTSSIHVYNLLGQKVYSASIPIQSTVQLDLSHLTDGAYQIVIDDGQYYYSRKLVITR
jgi:hypothetical protein